MKKRRLFILATILFMAIGFAAVTTTLVINGTLRVGSNPQDFDSNIVFIEAKTDDVSVAAISTDGKTINFVARELSSLGDEVVLDFVVKNKSRQYDAEATINCDYADKDNNYNEYANISINPSEFNLPAQEKQKGKLTVRLVKSFIGNEESETKDINFSCTISANALERENLASEVVEPVNVDAFNYITDLAEANTLELAYDGTGDNNLRYIGENPHNYVKFNNELWRIVGLMNNISDELGNKGSYLKIIRNESIGAYAYDIRYNGKFSEYDNDWSKASLMKVLNEEAYFNRTTGMCAKNTYPDTTYAVECGFTKTGLTEEAKRLIAKVVWPLGSLLAGNTNTEVANAYNFYEAERGKNVNEGHVSEWLGYVGLMYASDLGFTASGEKREACLMKTLTSESDCFDNSWLYNLNRSEWTLTPSNYPGNQHTASKYISSSYKGGTFGIRPVVFLYQNVKIMGGTGTEENPYLIA